MSTTDHGHLIAAFLGFDVIALDCNRDLSTNDVISSNASLLHSGCLCGPTTGQKIVSDRIIDFFGEAISSCPQTSTLLTLLPLLLRMRSTHQLMEPGPCCLQLSGSFGAHATALCCKLFQATLELTLSYSCLSLRGGGGDDT